MSRIGRASKTQFREQRHVLRTSVREPVVLVIEDRPFWSPAMKHLCDFLDVRVATLSECAELPAALRDQRPMAVLSEMESPAVDGCEVLKLVGAHDPDLPVMLHTGGDPVLAGAGEGVQEVLGLSDAVFVGDLPSPGEMMEFLFRAGQRGRCLGLMPA